jgi:hypothetical protein
VSVECVGFVGFVGFCFVVGVFFYFVLWRQLVWTCLFVRVENSG